MHPARKDPRMRKFHSARRADRKSTRLNSSHLVISYAVFCLKKKINKPEPWGIAEIPTTFPSDPRSRVIHRPNTIHERALLSRIFPVRGLVFASYRLQQQLVLIQ